jgi:ABC-type bacteriocin/lantibiotic exporter with double-glycine peptidase domain
MIEAKDIPEVDNLTVNCVYQIAVQIDQIKLKQGTPRTCRENVNSVLQAVKLFHDRITEASKIKEENDGEIHKD